jgi:hypothetical protein
MSAPVRLSFSGRSLHRRCFPEEPPMHRCVPAFVVSLLLFASASAKAGLDPNKPTWWEKFQFVQNGGAAAPGGATQSIAVGSDVDVSNECGPQSETYVTMRDARTLAGGSNEIFRLPMRAYFSSDGGKSWGGSDIPLPPPQGKNGVDFGSDPTLAFDTKGNLFYGSIVIFFGNGAGINGTQMSVARSADGGRTWTPNFFGFSGGSDHFNDKPMITTDRNLTSPFRDRVYLAWDAASGGSATGGGVLLATSKDSGATFTIVRADDPQGPGHAIGAIPFVGADGAVNVAWNDYGANTIAFSRSVDGGATFRAQSVIASKGIAFDAGVPAEFNRRALVYPACDADRTSGPHRGRLYCSWMDVGTMGTDIFLATSDNGGATWSVPRPVGDRLPFAVDRFNHWLAVDPITSEVVVSFYDTRNDTTGQRFGTDIYLARSSDGALTFAADLRASGATSNEHDCNGVFPCAAINYGNQQGDYSGLASYGGIAHPIWTDSRRNQAVVPACTVGAMEEVFTSAVR